MRGSKRCGCVVDKDGHPVHLCPMHEGLLASRVAKAKRKVFSGIRRSNPKVRHYQVYKFTPEDGIRDGRYLSRMSDGAMRWTLTRRDANYYSKADAEKEATRIMRIYIGHIAVAVPESQEPKANPGRRKRRMKVKKNPLGFALRATKGQGAVLWYTGRHFSSSQTPKYYSTVQAARVDGRKIAATYGNGPMRGYTLTIWTYPNHPK